MQEMQLLVLKAKRLKYYSKRDLRLLAYQLIEHDRQAIEVTLIK